MRCVVDCFVGILAPVVFAATMPLPAVRGEFCSTLRTRATATVDLATFRDEAFAAFRAQCRLENRPHPSSTSVQPDEITSCTFMTHPTFRHQFRFISGPLRAPFRVNFEVKTRTDALVALAEEATEDSMFAEIIVGGWYNTESAIRACHSDDCLVDFSVHREADIVSAEESRPFWVEYSDGVVTVGKGGEEAPFLAWDTSDYDVYYYPRPAAAEAYVGIASWSPGEWVFYQEFCD